MNSLKRKITIIISISLFLSLSAKAGVEADWIKQSKDADSKLKDVIQKVKSKKISSSDATVKTTIESALKAGVRVCLGEKTTGITNTYYADILESWAKSDNKKDRGLAALRKNDFTAKLTDCEEKPLLPFAGIDSKDLYLNWFDDLVDAENKESNSVLFGPQAMYFKGYNQLTQWSETKSQAAASLQKSLDYMKLKDFTNEKGSVVHPATYRYMVYAAALLSRMYREGVGVERDGAKANQIISDTVKIMSFRMAGLPKFGPDAKVVPYLNLPPELEAILK